MAEKKKILRLDMHKFFATIFGFALSFVMLYVLNILKLIPSSLSIESITTISLLIGFIYPLCSNRVEVD